NSAAATINVTYAPLPTAGVLTASSTRSGNFVSSPFNLRATFTSGIAVNSCEYSTDGSSWLAANVSGASPNFTCTKTGIAGTNGQVLNLNMRAANAGGTVYATALTLTVDSAPPVTSSNAPAGWVAVNQTI